MRRYIEGELASPETAAAEVLQLLENPSLAQGVVCSVRDF